GNGNGHDHGSGDTGSGSGLGGYSAPKGHPCRRSSSAPRGSEPSPSPLFPEPGPSRSRGSGRALGSGSVGASTPAGTEAGDELAHVGALGAAAGVGHGHVAGAEELEGAR